MTAYDVVFSPRSERHLVSICRQISKASGVVRAEDAAARWEKVCRSLRHFPSRGVPRPDVGLGVRVISHRRWAAIFYTVRGDTVTMSPVFSRGRDAGQAFDGDR